MDGFFANSPVRWSIPAMGSNTRDHLRISLGASHERAHVGGPFRRPTLSQSALARPGTANQERSHETTIPGAIAGVTVGAIADATLRAITDATPARCDFMQEPPQIR